MDGLKKDMLADDYEWGWKGEEYKEKEKKDTFWVDGSKEVKCRDGEKKKILRVDDYQKEKCSEKEKQDSKKWWWQKEIQRREKERESWRW